VGCSFSERSDLCDDQVKSPGGGAGEGGVGQAQCPSQFLMQPAPFYHPVTTNVAIT
jgi:hypothetical protein